MRQGFSDLALPSRFRSQRTRLTIYLKRERACTNQGKKAVQKNEKRSAKPRPLLKPRPRGATEQHLADAPFRERGPSTVSVAQEPFGSGWSFLRKQNLTLARRSECFRGWHSAPPRIRYFRSPLSRA